MTNAPHLDYDIGLAQAGEIKVSLYLVPTRPLQAQRGLRLGVGLDDHTPTEIEASIGVVLDRIVVETPMRASNQSR